MGQMSKASEEIFYTTNEYLTYKMSRYFDTYVLLLGLKDNSGFFMDFVGGAGVYYHLYKQTGPAVFAFIDDNYKVLRGDDAEWITNLALKTCQQYNEQLFNEQCVCKTLL